MYYALLTPVKATAIPSSTMAPPNHSRGSMAKAKVAGRSTAREAFERVVSGGLRKTVNPTVVAGRCRNNQVQLAKPTTVQGIDR